MRRRHPLQLKRGFALIFSAIAIGCGARTTLTDVDVTTTNTSSDACTAAVWPNAPKPMNGYCSTRDGRARGISAPTSPHVIWTTAIPYDDDVSAIDRATTIVTDDSANAYVASYITIGGDAPVFNKVDVTSGAIELTAPAAESKNGLALLLPSTRTIDVFNSETQLSIASFQPSSPTPNATFSFEISPISTLDPAIGSDGALYFDFAATPAGDPNASSIHVTRGEPDGVITWTSVDLISLGPTADTPVIDNALPTGIALEPADDEIVVASSITSSESAFTMLNGLDATIGTPRWTSVFPGQSSPPVIASDGTIGVVASEGQHVVNAEFFLLDANGNTILTDEIDDAVRVIGVTTDNHFLVATTQDVRAIDEQGNTLWIQNVDADDYASIGDNGIAIVKGEFGITGLDLETGAVRWTLDPPHAGTCISSGTLALSSNGTLVALQCDGTLFGASD